MGGLASNVVSAHAGVHLQQIVKTFVDCVLYEMFFHPRQKQLRGKSATSRRARHCATRARAAMVELRTVALFAWVASLAHLLVVFNRIDDFSPGALALVLTSLAGALPAIWGASVVVFAPGDLRAALDVALGRAKPLASSAPVAAVFTPLGSSRPSPSPSATRESPSVAVSQLGGLSLASSDDDEDDDRRGWLDVITGIRGMAQALHDANDSASSVALNADLTVSLSALVLKTLALVDPTAENPELGSREDARARQLTDPRAVIKDTCTLAEPLFEAETPLVLRNRLPANELRFIPRDVLSCCLFALLHRAGTRILRGECAMTVDKTRDVAMDSTASTLIARSVASGSIFDHPGGAHRLTPGTASSSDSRRSGGVAEPRLEAGASPPRSWAIRVAVEYRTAAVGRSDPKLGATELRFWRRRMRRVGGSLRLEHVPVDVSTRVERVILTVPTAGSDTYFGEEAAARAAKGTGKTPKVHGADGGGDGGGASGSGDGTGEGRSGGGAGEASTRLAAASPSPFPFPHPREGDRTASGNDADVEDFEPSGTNGSARRSRRDARGGEPVTDAYDSNMSSFHDSLFDTRRLGEMEFKILYVEDERVQAYFFINKCKRMFGDRCTVVHERDGVAALERLKAGEQFVVIVSDIFMVGMDGVSFFQSLFSTDYNSGAISAGGHAVVNDAALRMNLILTSAEISPDLREDRELAVDLARLGSRHGVLCYNKTSGVDVVLDVIKPHVRYVEMRMADLAQQEHARTSLETEPSLRRDDRRAGGDDGGARPEDRYDVDRSDWKPPPLRRAVVEPEPPPTTSPTAAVRGYAAKSAEVDAWVEGAAAYSLVMRSGSSVGGKNAPFPDVSGLAGD